MNIGAMKAICTDLAIASAAVVYTNSFSIGFADVFGLWIKTTSVSGTPSLLIELQQSYTTPATEGSADTNFVVPDGFSNIYADLADEVAHVIGIAPKPMAYARFKITGSGSNPADSLLTMKVFVQEQS